MESTSDPSVTFLAGGGEMGRRIREHDWAGTPLGRPAGWPQPLRTAIRLLLNTGHPMYLFWGAGHTCFYNDAYSRSIGAERHPGSLGRPGRIVWDEIWHVIGPQIEQVMAGGGATWHENQLVPITRHGRREDVWWTYSYSPVDSPDAASGVGGVLVICTETTRDVALRRSEEQLRLAVDAADIGLWDLDLTTDELYWPPRVKAMFGISPGVEVDMDDFREGLHPEDRAAVEARFAEALDPAVRAQYDVEYRTVGKEDGVVRWVAAKGRGIFDAHGRCVRAIGSALDITERKRIEEALRASEAALRRADQRKDAFLATLAHELRNPLAPIHNAASVLQHPGLDAPAVAKWARMIHRHSTTMTVLLDDLLEVSRVSLDRLELRTSRAPVERILDTAIEAVQPAAEARRHRLVVENEAPGRCVEVDVLRLSQALTNLLANAVKYTDPGGEIRLRCHAGADGLALEVRDTGIGLAEADLPGLFEMFYQAPSGRPRHQGGLGIGLALAERLVRLHGGTLRATSDGPGAGSTFTIVLPKALVEPDDAPGPAAPADAAPGESAVPRSVMVVDDNADAAQSLAGLLEMSGWNVLLAPDGETALEQARAARPAAYLLDIGLPGMSGYALAERLRGMPESKDALLVAITGWGQQADRDRSRRSGFDRHLTKPVDFDELLAIIEDERTRG